MSGTTIKLQVVSDEPRKQVGQTSQTQTSKTQSTTAAQTTQSNLEKIVKSPLNPLYNVEPPKYVADDPVLLQAKEIKSTLDQVFALDPTARCHSFSYGIFKENAELLMKQGFQVRYYGDPTVTEVSWMPTVERQLVF